MNPYLFIVGCPRSGTTLLQRLVDSHPQIAVTPETHWIPRWYNQRTRKGISDGLVTKKFLRKLRDHPRFLELGIELDGVVEAIGGRGRVPYDRLISTLFDLYGQRRGKPIVGDKTPGYARELATLHHLWPSARFVHLIRDGRDVCLSILKWERATGWKTGEGAARFRTWAQDPVGTAALWWEWHVGLARQAGEELGQGLYYELRYESLVARPTDECRALCEFLGVPYDDRMVGSYQERAMASPSQDAKHPWMPITSGLRDWQSQMSSEAVERFEAVAGTMLDELGYRRGAPSPRPEELEYAARARDWFALDAHGQRYSVPRNWSPAGARGTSPPRFD
jgi:Sulfotransferase family